MALANYSDLTTAIGNWSNRPDLSARSDEFIALCESAIQAKCKLLESETTATVTITAGVGTLPTGYVGMRSVYWVGSPNRPLSYIDPERYDWLRNNDSGDGYYYTISGSSIMTTPMGSGSVVCTYMGRFVGLSGSNTTNAIMTNFPDAYVFGCQLQLAIYADDDAAMQKYGILFNAACDRINQNNEDRRYGGSTLQVRAR